MWWSPPLSIVSDLELPGPDPATVSISELHLVLDVKAMTIAAAARHFGVPIAVIRLLLERFPIDRPVGASSTQLERLRARLTPEDFTHMHHRDALSITTIAERFDVRRKAVSTLAREYNIETRGGGSHPRLNIDPGWFRRQYVENHRTLTDIANDIGASISAVSRFATLQEIPIVRDPRVLRKPTNKTKSSTDRPKAPPHGRSSAIDPSWLRHEYVVKRRSVAELADELGVAKSTVNRQVKKHGFSVPPSRKPTKPKKEPVTRQRLHVDPDWLRQEYQEKQRTLTDIARELGISLSTLSRLAQNHGLAIKRGRQPRPVRARTENCQTPDRNRTRRWGTPNHAGVEFCDTTYDSPVPNDNRVVPVRHLPPNRATRATSIPTICHGAGSGILNQAESNRLNGAARTARRLHR